MLQCCFLVICSKELNVLIPCLFLGKIYLSFFPKFVCLGKKCEHCKRHLHVLAVWRARVTEDGRCPSRRWRACAGCCRGPGGAIVVSHELHRGRSQRWHFKCSWNATDTTTTTAGTKTKTPARRRWSHTKLHHWHPVRKRVWGEMCCMGLYVPGIYLCARLSLTLSVQRYVSLLLTALFLVWMVAVKIDPLPPTHSSQWCSWARLFIQSLCMLVYLWWWCHHTAACKMNHDCSIIANSNGYVHTEQSVRPTTNNRLFSSFYHLYTLWDWVLGAFISNPKW